MTNQNGSQISQSYPGYRDDGLQRSSQQNSHNPPVNHHQNQGNEKNHQNHHGYNYSDNNQLPRNEGSGNLDQAFHGQPNTIHQEYQQQSRAQANGHQPNFNNGNPSPIKQVHNGEPFSMHQNGNGQSKFQGDQVSQVMSTTYDLSQQHYSQDNSTSHSFQQHPQQQLQNQRQQTHHTQSQGVAPHHPNFQGQHNYPHQQPFPQHGSQQPTPRDQRSSYCGDFQDQVSFHSSASFNPMHQQQPYMNHPYPNQNGQTQQALPPKSHLNLGAQQHQNQNNNTIQHQSQHSIHPQSQHGNQNYPPPSLNKSSFQANQPVMQHQNSSAFSGGSGQQSYPMQNISSNHNSSNENFARHESMREDFMQMSPMNLRGSSFVSELNNPAQNQLLQNQSPAFGNMSGTNGIQNFGVLDPNQDEIRQLHLMTQNSFVERSNFLNDPFQIMSINDAKENGKLEITKSNPSIGQMLCNLVNYLMIEFHTKMIEFGKLAERQSEKFKVLQTSNQFKLKDQAELYRKNVVEPDKIGQYDRIKQLKTYIKNAKFLIENIQVALQSASIEQQFAENDEKFQSYLRLLSIKTFELLGKQEVFEIEKKAFLVRQLEQSQDPQFDLKTSFRVLSHKFDRPPSRIAIVNVAGVYQKSKELINLVKFHFLGPQNSLLRRVEEEAIQKKVLRKIMLKLHSSNLEKEEQKYEAMSIKNEQIFNVFGQIKISRIEQQGCNLLIISEGIMKYVLKLDYIFEEKIFIILLQDFIFEGGLDDQSLLDTLKSKISSANRAVIQRMDQKKRLIGMINNIIYQKRENAEVSQIQIIHEKLSMIFKQLIFKKFHSEIQSHKNVKGLQRFPASNNQGESLQFLYTLSKNEKPIEVVIQSVEGIGSLEKVEYDFKMFEINLSRPLPVLSNDEIIKMSRKSTIYGNGSSSFNLKEYLQNLDRRFQYIRLIEYYENFKDEATLNFPSVVIDLEGENQKVKMRVFQKMILEFQIISQTGFQLVYSSHLSTAQTNLLNLMLKVTDPKRFSQVNIFFKVLVPHCFFRLIEFEIEQACPQISISKSIDSWVDVRRSHIISCPSSQGMAFGNYQFIQGQPLGNISLLSKYKTGPLFQSWLLKSLQKNFSFDLKLLAVAEKELFQSQIVFIINAPAQVNELDMRFEKKPRNIEYVEVSLAEDSERYLANQTEIILSLKHTQLFKHLSNQPQLSLNLQEINEILSARQSNEVALDSLLKALTEGDSFDKLITTSERQRAQQQMNQDPLSLPHQFAQPQQPTYLGLPSQNLPQNFNSRESVLGSKVSQPSVAANSMRNFNQGQFQSHNQQQQHYSHQQTSQKIGETLDDIIRSTQQRSQNQQMLQQQQQQRQFNSQERQNLTPQQPFNQHQQQQQFSQSLGSDRQMANQMHQQQRSRPAYGHSQDQSASPMDVLGLGGMDNDIAINNDQFDMMYQMNNQNPMEGDNFMADGNMNQGGGYQLPLRQAAPEDLNEMNDDAMFDFDN